MGGGMKTSERPRVFSLVCVSLSLSTRYNTHDYYNTRDHPELTPIGQKSPPEALSGKSIHSKTLKIPRQSIFFFYKEAVPILFIKKTGSGWSTLFFLPEADAPTM